VSCSLSLTTSPLPNPSVCPFLTSTLMGRQTEWTRAESNANMTTISWLHPIMYTSPYNDIRGPVTVQLHGTPEIVIRRTPAFTLDCSTGLQPKISRYRFFPI
jgi:hypothetical protein